MGARRSAAVETQQGGMTMSDKKKSTTPKAPKASKAPKDPNAKRVHLKPKATVEAKLAFAMRLVGRLQGMLGPKNVATDDLAIAASALVGVNATVGALPDDWKLSGAGRGAGKTGAFAPGGQVQLKAKHAPKYEGALPATGLEVVAVAGTLVQVKLAGGDGAACAFVPRAHLEAAAKEAAQA
jgi:hypothetical protein